MLKMIADKINVTRALHLLVLSTFFLILFASQMCHALEQAQQLMRNAVTYSKQGNHMMALKLSEQAIKLEPTNIALIYQRASVWGRGGYYANAIKDLSQVIREDELAARKKFPAARKFRAECFVATGQMQKAVDDYNVLLRGNPQSGKIWYYMAETLAVMKRMDWALQAVERGIATGTHWSKNLETLKKEILSGQEITPHKPFSN